MKRLIFTVCAVVILVALYYQALNVDLFGYGSQRMSAQVNHKGQSKSSVKKRAKNTSFPDSQEKCASSYQLDREPNPYPIPKRIDLGHIEGKGIGYDVGYTKLSLILGPEYKVGNNVAMLDVRGVVFDDGRWAANAGIISRYLPSTFCEVFGWNVFYDFREGKLGNFNQISGGLEMLHRRWELHASARIPVGRTEHTKKCVFNNYVGPYREERKSHQFALDVYDFDVGYYFMKGKNFQIYGQATSYYLTGRHGTSAFGGRALLRPQFADYFAVELSVSHDHIYETILQVNAIISIPLYKMSSNLKNKSGPCCVTSQQIYQPIDRDVVLRTKRDYKYNW